MLGKIFSVFSVIREVLKLISIFRDYIKRQEEEKQKKLKDELEKAVADSKKAETDEEIWDSQNRITKRD